jgi:hypothetical protein
MEKCFTGSEAGKIHEGRHDFELNADGLRGVSSFTIDMKYNCFLAGLAGQLFLLTLFAVDAGADTLRTQVIHLHKGWNAVFVEVDPVNSKPDVFFQGTPVTMAAAFTGADRTVQFVQNPSTNLLTRQNGWDIWYAPSRADAFLTSLFQIAGNKPYLLYSDSDFTLFVNGNSVLNSAKWKPNSFTLTGFGVDEVSPPTFDQFFDGSSAHHPYRIYRLINDAWVKVDNAKTTQMHSGEAYWIYCQGGSDFQGPLTAQIQIDTAVLLRGGKPAGVMLQNNTRNPLNVCVQNITGGGQLPVAYVLRAVTATNVLTATYDLPDNFPMQPFDAAEKRGFWLTLRSERMNMPEQTGLLKITTDLGTQNWLPISSKRTVDAAN